MKIEPPPSRLCGAHFALQRGYTQRQLQQIMRKLDSFEQHLSRLFGARFDQVRIRDVTFIEERRGMRGAPVAVSGRQDLVIDPRQNSPRSLLDKLDYYAAHEYGHLLTLNDRVLWEGVSQGARDWAGLSVNVRQESDLRYKDDLVSLKVFARSLPEGIENPFIDGLKNGDFDIFTIYGQIAEMSSGHSVAEGVMDRLLFVLGELVADRIAVLTLPDSPAKNRVIRKDLARMIGNYKDNRSGDIMQWGFILLAHLRVFAEKTGNADLLPGREARSLTPLYDKLCRIFSSLWGGIDLHRP